MRQQRFHIIDFNCRARGGQDYGAVRTYTEATQIVQDLIKQGHTGGCRCTRSGWKIRTCEEVVRVKADYFAKEHKIQAELFDIPEEVWKDHFCPDFDPKAWDIIEGDL